jgi:virginiamycin A acetyltransferase
MSAPDKHTLFPLANYERLCFLKNIIKKSDSYQKSIDEKT